MNEEQAKILLNSDLGEDLNFIYLIEQVLIYDKDDEDLTEDYSTYLLLEADVGRWQSATGPQRKAALLKAIQRE